LREKTSVLRSQDNTLPDRGTQYFLQSGYRGYFSFASESFLMFQMPLQRTTTVLLTIGTKSALKRKQNVCGTDCHDTAFGVLGET